MGNGGCRIRRLERVLLSEDPESEWDIVFSDEGLAIVASNDSDPVEVEDILKVHLFASVQTGRELLQWEEGVPPCTITTWLDEHMCAHTTGSLTCNMAEGNATSTVGIFRFSMPRAGCVLFWNLLDVYDMCGLVASGGGRWDWVGRGLVRWSKFLAGLGLEGHLIKGPQHRHEIERHGEDAGRVTKWPAGTTAAVLALLARWCSCSPARGGLQAQSALQGAHAALVAALRVAAPPGARFVARLFWDDDVELRWPRPPVGARPFSLKVAGGRVDLRPLREMHMMYPHVQMGAIVGQLSPESEAATFLEVWAAATSMATSGRPSLLRQLVAVVAPAFEEVAVSGRPLSTGVFATVVTEAGSDDHELLLGQWQAQQQLSTPSPLVFSLATDKSIVRTFSTQMTAVVLPSNRAVFLTPQVYRGEGVQHPGCGATRSEKGWALVGCDQLFIELWFGVY